MPRPIVLSNGSLFVGYDDRYAMRDLFYPRNGGLNHLNGFKARMGVWIDGRFSWCDSPGWVRSLKYEPGALIALVSLEHRELGIRMLCREAIDPEECALVRQIDLKNLTSREYQIKLYFTHDLHIAQSDVGDTALYLPQIDAMVHYKGNHVFGFFGEMEGKGIAEYSAGIKGFDGLEGTWRDAEDGRLSGNPIAQGSVDSTFGLEATVSAGSTVRAEYRMICASSLDRLELLSATGSVFERSQAHWQQQIAGSESHTTNLPSEIRDQFDRSLMLVLAHFDRGGAIVAANDSDILETNRANYCYTWPRDGAFVSMVLDRIGAHEASRSFLDFCMRLTTKERPYFLHKYCVDGTLGASWHPWVIDGEAEAPFQEDETALVVLAVCRHFEATCDEAWMRGAWDLWMDAACRFLVAHVDPQTDLPKPSYDVWEERRGVHAFTVASVIAALEAAVGTCRSLRLGSSAEMAQTAQRMRSALTTHLWVESRQCFLRGLLSVGREDLQPDPTIDSAVLSILLFGALPADDPRVITSMDRIVNTLTVRSPVGGLARYEGDYYFRASESYPGNPWLICTLWLAQCRLARARTAQDLDEPMRWLLWACDRATESRVLAEQWHPETGAPLSVSPLTWSHAEFLQTVLDYQKTATRLGVRQTVQV